MMNIRNILIGILLGVLSVFSPVMILVLGSFFISIWCIKRYIRTEGRDFLVTIFVIGFIMRMILSSVNYTVAEFAGMGADTQPDARVYNNIAFYIASNVTGNKLTYEMDRDPALKRDFRLVSLANKGQLPPVGTYQCSIFVYLIGWIYAWLGYAPVAVKMINGLMGCIAAILTYLLARLLVKSEITAKISAAIMIFLPSTLYWSVTLLKDPMVNCLFLLYCVMLLGYLKRARPLYVIIALTSLALLGLLKEKIIILLAIPFIGILGLDFVRRQVSAKRSRLWTMVMPAIFILATLFMLNHDAISNFIQHKIDMMVTIHLSSRGYSTATTYNLYGDMMEENGRPDFGSPLLIIKALAYYFLTPFPWYVPHSHALLLLFYPQVILTFLSIPFIFIGIMAAFRRNFFAVATTAFLLLVVVVPQAMTEAIIGNVVRHRDMFMPFLIIFAVYGFCLKVVPEKRIVTAADASV